MGLIHSYLSNLSKRVVLPVDDVNQFDNRDEAAVARLASFIDTVIRPYFRAEIRGCERVVAGAGLFVGNHNAGLLAPEAFLLGATLFKKHGIEAVPYSLMGDLPLKIPMIKKLFVPLGVVRACRENGLKLLMRGSKVLVFPGGDIEALRSYRDRDRIIFDNRRGYIRLALRAGVPIYPVVTAGAHSTFIVLTDGRRLMKFFGTSRWLRLGTWPITLCLPWGVIIGPGLIYLPWPTRIIQEVLPPIYFERSGESAAADDEYVRVCAENVESTMQATLTRLAAERARYA
ncbi:MAG: acyltransferase family protein [Bdellovibrio sp.]|nr:acyltransferase family protein [Bdellovibrio sp.]